MLIYSYLNTRQTFDAFEGLYHFLKNVSTEKLFSIHFPRLFSVTNLSKIWNEARVYELPSPGMEDIALQWLPNLPPAPSFHPNARRLVSLRTNGLGGYIIKFV